MPAYRFALQFALCVRELHRQGMPAERIAEKLGASLDDCDRGAPGSAIE